MSMRKTIQWVNHKLLVSGIGLSVLLAACKPVAEGWLQLEDSQVDWSGYQVQLFQNDIPVGKAVPVAANGSFVMAVPHQVQSDTPLIAEAYNGLYRLRALADHSPLIISAKTSARLALADRNHDGQLQMEETAFYEQPDAQQLDILHNVLHTVFSAAFSDNEENTLLLKQYPDSWQLAQILASNQKHQISFMLKHHDALVRSYALLHKQADFGSTTNPEMPYMLRLSNNGLPLRWQHLSYAQQPWACVDYFEKGLRRPDLTLGNWPLGVRLWAVDPQLQGDIASSQIASILQLYNTEERCHYRGWRLPNRTELLTLTNRKTGDWDFPLSLPFSHPGRFWIQGTQGQPHVLDINTGTIVNEQLAQLLPLSFTADPPPPQKERQTTPFDINTLRQMYTQAPQHWPAPQVDKGVQWLELGTLPPMPFPADNPYSQAKVQLGQVLFFDKSLSANNNIACASCHLPDQQWSDQRRRSSGTHGENGSRNAMPIINTGYNPSLFWDGRVSTLEEQSIHPILDKLEMALTLDQLLEKLNANPAYPALFKAAFGDEQITLARYQKAVATFERTLISQPAALDRFLAGEHSALNDQQIHGLHLYRTKARCMNCHSGPLLTDYTFRNTGLTYYGRELEDLARFRHSHKIADTGAFRVPSLRDIAFSAPYMHNGVFPVLARQSRDEQSVGGVIPMYNAGMTKGRNANYPQYQHKYDPFFPVVDDLIQPLGMSNEEMLALAAFLEAVSAPPRHSPANEQVLQNPLMEINNDARSDTQ